MSDDLVKFMQARLDEDEAAAKDAPNDLDGQAWPFWIDVDDQGDYDATNDYRDRFPPNRMLREAQNKRAILDMWEPPEWVADPKLRPDAAENFHDGRDWNEIDEQVAAADAIDHVVRILVCAWSDHPDFRQEWKP